MNFYLGNSIEKMKGDEENVELDDEMLEYLYSIKERIPFIAFFKIDPYSVIVVEKEDILDIISMCEYILKEQLLNEYEEKEDIKLAISKLSVFGRYALKNGEKMLVIGD